jgi:hypothetical protein
MNRSVFHREIILVGLRWKNQWQARISRNMLTRKLHCLIPIPYQHRFCQLRRSDGGPNVLPVCAASRVLWVMVGENDIPDRLISHVSDFLSQ